MKRVGIVIEAISNLKVLGSFLESSNRLDINPVVFIPEWRKGKPYDSITADTLCRVFPHISPQDVLSYPVGELAATVSKQAVSLLVLLNPYRNFVHDVPRLAERGIAVYGLDYFVNSIYVTASGDEPRPIERALAALRHRVVASCYWRDLEFAVQPNHKKFADRFVALGTPVIDPFATIDPLHARQILGISGQKPIVSLFTPNIRDHQAYFFYGLGTWLALRRLARMVRQYCDRHGYRLVVKSRQKQWDAVPFLAVADDFIDDRPELVYPSASALLLGASTLALHFGSMMVLEAAAAHVPSIGFSVEAVDKLHGYMRPEVRPLLRQRILVDSPGLFHSGLVSQAVSVYTSRRAFEKTADSMIDSRDYAKKEYNTFNATFSGWQTGSLAADRLAALITAVN